MRRLLLLFSFFALSVSSSEPVATGAFADGAKHYRDGTGSDAYTRLAPEQVAAIADNILLHQRDNGGWASNWDPQRELTEHEVKELAAARSKEDTTFDNRATYTQIEYLCAAHQQTGDARYLAAAVRGFEFMLEAQHPCGGFPHSYPNRGNYRPYITFMDDVTAGALTVLRKAGLGQAPFAALEPELRARLLEAANSGTDCILKLQQPWEGTPAVWGGQYDPKTLKPTMARMFEQPGFVCAESVGVVDYLMRIDPPTPEIIAAVEGAVKWFKAAKLHGIRVEVIDIEPVRFDNHTAKRDVRIVEDLAAPPLWARFYEFDTNRPFMANRDGVNVYKLEEVALERRSGYNWYGTYPAQLLENYYPEWRARHAALLASTPAGSP